MDRSLADSENYNFSITMIENSKCTEINKVSSQLINKYDLIESYDEGITFSDKKDGFNGRITKDQISFSTKYIDDANEKYEQIKSWFNDTSVEIPEFDEFKVGGATIRSNLPNRAIDYRDSKFNNYTVCGCKYTYNNIECTVTPVQEKVSIHFESKINYNDAVEFLEHCINNDLFKTVNVGNLSPYRIY